MKGVRLGVQRPSAAEPSPFGAGGRDVQAFTKAKVLVSAAEAQRMSADSKIAHEPARPSFRTRVLFALGLVLASASLVGCGHPQVSLAERPPSYTPRDYQDVLARWTRSDRIIAFAELDARLTVSATWKSPDFRAAYVARYARDYRLDAVETKKLLDDEIEEATRGHEFYVALSGENRRAIDLTKPSSEWIVRLVDDRGNETAPESIVAIPKPGPDLRTYFPYTTVWRQAFRVTFPVTTSKGPTIAADATKVSLHFAGARGDQALVWELTTR